LETEGLGLKWNKEMSSLVSMGMTKEFRLNLTEKNKSWIRGIGLLNSHESLNKYLILLLERNVYCNACSDTPNKKNQPNSKAFQINVVKTIEQRADKPNGVSNSGKRAVFVNGALQKNSIANLFITVHENLVQGKI
jgi:hypothetical protein